MAIIYDESIYLFLQSISNYDGEEGKYYSFIRELISSVAPQLMLARIEIKYNVKESPMFTANNSGVVIVYSNNEGFNRECVVSNDFPVMDMGDSTMSFYSQKGVFWDEADKSIISFIMQMMNTSIRNFHIENMLKKVTYTDMRTGLPNNEAFMKYINELVQKGEVSQYTVGYVNIKNFRFILKKHGNTGAMDVLRKFGRVVKNFLIDGEMIARMGGDNFEVLFKKERYNGFIDYLSHINIPIKTEEGVTPTDISVRGGFYEIEGDNKAEEITNSASVALSVAKSKGTSDFVKLDPYMIERIMMEKEITSVFSQALEDMEFKVFFQPKVNLENNKICGAEALVRWFKNGEIIPPSEFIPVLERAGKISSIDFYVLESVCKSIREWLDKGIEVVRISVNLSKLNLYNRNLTEEIVGIMEKYGIENKYIEIELTEMSGYEDYDALCVFVNNMKKLGIKTSIDDFGTGYSSFNLIKDLNTDIIKLDRSFLINIDKNNRENSRNDEIVIKNIVNMVNELDMEVIAEGVENIEQAEFLKEINCLKVQGFLFDKPLPIEEFEKILVQKKVYSITA